MGDYSGNIPRKTAETLVLFKKDIKELNKKVKFWLAFGDEVYLHYGITGLQGMLPLNKKGKKYYEKTFEELIFGKYGRKY
jgi:hypothetical protein